MIKQVSDLLNALLIAFNAENGNVLSGIYPLLASVKTELPLAVYRVSKEQVVSKDGLYDLKAEILILSKSYEQLIDIEDKIEDKIDTDQNFHFERVDFGIDPEATSEYYAIIEYKLLMNK